MLDKLRTALGRLWRPGAPRAGSDQAATPQLESLHEEMHRHPDTQGSHHPDPASVEEPVGNGDPSSGQASPPAPRQTYAINARGMAVVAALFHDPGGERRAPLLLWGDFKAMMASLGFELRNGDGSRRTFVPRAEAWARGWRRTTHFHEPRGGVPVRTARAGGRQLAEAYGWSFDSFVRR
ncbi:hypothetical protein DL770_007148 [Monosporascus sp. CRB-9-2]|nr:hypothetical protein DL770_007148 [Monosporascus sp. CRB-9-2]